MNLTHLRCVIEVARVGSISGAAQNLYMGQPNLSKMIKDFEKSMGIVIFRRTAKGVEPTEKGAEMIKRAQKLLAQADEFEAMFSDKGDDKRLFAAVPNTVYCSAAFASFAASAEKSSGFDVSCLEADAGTALKLISDGKADIAVIRYKSSLGDYFGACISGSGLKAELLAEYRLRLLISENHPLIGCEEISRSDLSEYTEIIVGEEQGPELVSDERELPFPAKKIRLSDRIGCYELLSAAKDTYMWVSPDGCPKSYRLVTKECGFAETCRDVLVYPEEKKLSEFENAFIRQLKAQVKSWS